MSFRIFYAAGPGNVIAAHKHWINGDFDPSEMSLTYSGQFASFCDKVGAEAYIVSYHYSPNTFSEGSFILEHRPKPMSGASGMRYHISEILYGLGLLVSAIRFRADVTVIVSGTTHYFMLCLFRLARIKVVVVLHNTLWPAGYPPTRVTARLLLQLDSLFFRYFSTATMGVSRECIRQAAQVSGGQAKNLHEFRSQFRSEYFAGIPVPPGGNNDVFRILYAGRINRNKGVFDILAIAQQIDVRMPGRAHWTLCGSGPDLDDLKRRHEEMGLEAIVSIRGWTPPEEMRSALAECHASIVPTRSDFSEGMAKTVVESVLSGRPVITNPVVPALEMLRSACVEASTDSVESYIDAIQNLIDDPGLYHALCEACPELQRQFYDRGKGFCAILEKVISRPEFEQG
jgi:glycogen synthase